MSKHTAGPWKVKVGGCAMEIVADYADNFPIANNSTDGLSFHSGKADAQLMATAPELLQALKKYRDFMATDSADWGEGYLKVSDLIDKAEGAK